MAKRKVRPQDEKTAHAKAERDRYALLKRGLEKAITEQIDTIIPCCSVLVTRRYGRVEVEDLCGVQSNLEIDHVHFTKFKQRRLNSVQRLERFAIEFIKWVGGDEKYALRLACRKHNARHQPRRTRR